MPAECTPMPDPLPALLAAWIAADDAFSAALDSLPDPVNPPPEIEAQGNSINAMGAALLSTPATSLNGALALINVALHYETPAGDPRDPFDLRMVLVRLAQTLRTLGADVPTPSLDHFIAASRIGRVH